MANRPILADTWPRDVDTTCKAFSGPRISLQDLVGRAGPYPVRGRHDVPRWPVVAARADHALACLERHRNQCRRVNTFQLGRYVTEDVAWMHVAGLVYLLLGALVAVAAVVLFMSRRPRTAVIIASAFALRSVAHSTRR